MATFTGGYSQIDCTGIELTTATKQTVTGIYKQVDTALKANKFVLACGLKFGSNPCTPTPVMINDDPNGDELVCTSSVLQLFVGADDGVRVVNMAPANRAVTRSKKEE